MQRLDQLLNLRNATNISFESEIRNLGGRKTSPSTKCDCNCTEQGNCNCSRCDW